MYNYVYINVIKAMFDRKAYNRRWVYNKRHGLPTRTTPKLDLTAEDRRIRKNNRNKEYTKRRKENRKRRLIEKFDVGFCPICEETYRMQLHRKDGKPHKTWVSITNAEFDKVIQSDDYIWICYWCHKHIHWCMKYLRMTWDEIKTRLKL